MRFLRISLAWAVVLCALCAAAQWVPIGPDGGDVRSLTYDPQNPDRIFLGTSAGQLFLSTDAGATWSRFAHLGDGDDYVLDNVVIDPQQPQTIYVAAWSVNHSGGDLFRSHDGGKTWEALPGLHGKSLRALAMAPSDPRMLVVGALDGVFRSHDGGDTWERISPPNHAEIKNIESVAIDPFHPELIYAGTWHLPWRTVDGGRTWESIKHGIIDDSDVFSIIVDRTTPTVVYLSACSGIYKSESAGDSFRKIQGIPFSARRTRVLQQDPVNPGIVYAGTTEGLWRTTDAGKTWKRITDPNLIVNDVLVDPRHPERLLLATDRSGVLASNDGGLTFAASNRGFAHRQVGSVLADRNDPATIYAGVVNDKEFGGVFVTHDSGRHWQQMNAGLAGHDIFTLRQSDSGELLAGTNQGVFAFRAQQGQWQSINLVLSEKLIPRFTKARKPLPPRVQILKSQLAARVTQLALAPGRWLAATSAGLFTSLDQGNSWHGGAVAGMTDFIATDAMGDALVAATSHSVLLSRNGGSSWAITALPPYVTLVYGAALVPPNTLWITTREGVFFTSDDGATWEHVLVGLPARQLASVSYDRSASRLLGMTAGGKEVFESRDAGKNWSLLSTTGFSVRSLSVTGGQVLGLTGFDGLVVPPDGVQSTGRAAASSVNQ